MQFKDIYPCSTNDMYIPCSARGGHGAYLRKSGTLNAFQTEFWNMMTDLYLDDIVRFLEYSRSKYEHLGFKLTLWIGMNDMWYIRNPDDIRPYDASNYIKAIEDLISNRIEIDDKYNMEVRVVKYGVDSERWIITAEMEPIDFHQYDTANGFEEPTKFGLILDESEVIKCNEEESDQTTTTE